MPQNLTSRSRMLLRAAIVVLGSVSSAAAVAAAPPTYLPHASPAGTPQLPFSDAVLSGDTLYVAGHLGIDAHTGNAAADPAVEARLVMEAVKHTVEAAGLTMNDLVSVTIFCTDVTLYETFNSVYRGYFKDHYPARAFIGADKLVRGAHFEVMGIAVRSGGAAHP